MKKRKSLSLGQKTVCAILVLAFVLAATAVFISYRIYAGTMDAHYREQTMNVAKTAASVVDGDRVRFYTEAVKEIYLRNPSPQFESPEQEAAYMAGYDRIRDSEYHEVYLTLEKVKEANSVLSLYIVYMDKPTMTCVYVVDADTSETACPAGSWDIIYEQNYAAMDTPEKGFPAYITNTEDFGWLCSAGAPIMDSQGRVIAHAMVDISMDSVMQDRQGYLARLCLILLMVTVLLILIFIRVVNRAVVRPVNLLALAASAYVLDIERTKSGGQSMIEKLDIRTGDEVENLCSAIKQMEKDINGYIENLTAVTAEKERIGAELSVATQIQASMLPCIFPAFPERPEFDIYADMIPAKEVGGDFYDFFLVNEDYLALVMADVSGKGVPAALFMVIAKTLIKNHVQLGESPAAAFTTVNQTLCENNDAGLFVTAWLGILKISTGELTYANAGHNPPMLCRKGGSFEYLRGRSGFVLAGMEGMAYRQEELVLKSGDMLYLYTDGVTEATDIYSELYGEKRLPVYLNRNKDKSLDEILNGLKGELDEFVKGAPQFDDITMLLLRFL